MKRIVAVLLGLALLLSGIGCAEYELTDQAGRVVTMEHPAEKVVSCYYIFSASLLALGCGDRLVGVEDKADSRALYALAAPELMDLPAVGSGKGINLEAILALDPDAVILPRKLQDDAERLAELGIPTFVGDPESGEKLAECLRMLGGITGREERAEELLAKYDAMADEVAQAVAGAERPAVYMAAEHDVLSTYPAGMYQNKLIEGAGGRNVAGEIEGVAKVTIDAEQLLNWDPAYIFIVAGADYSVEDVLNDPQLASVQAVRDGNVFAMPGDVEPWDYPTPSSALGVLYLAGILHRDCVDVEAFDDRAAEFYRDVYGFERD